MKVLPRFVPLFLFLLTVGCRTTDSPYESELPTGIPLAASSAYDVSAAAHISAAGRNHRVVQAAAIQMPEPLPAPPTTRLPTSDLTLADLEDTALANNPALVQASSLVEAAQGTWLQVGLVPNPVLGYSGQQLGSGGQAEQQGVFLGQEFVTGHKLSLNREVAGWEVERIQQNLEAVRLRVLTDVRIGYYDVLIAQRRRDLSANLLGISERAVEAAQALFRGDEVSEADPLRARVETDQARILLENAANQHVEAWRRLAAVLGTPDLELKRLDGRLEPDGIELSWDETLQQVLSESPEMAAALADVEAARWAINRAHAEVVPNVEVQTVVQGDRGTGSTNANLQVTLPLPLINRNQGGIQRAYAESVAAERAVDRLTLDLQARLASAFQRYQSARNQVDRYSRTGGILQNAERTLELIRAGYRAEEFDVLDLLTAQRTYFQTNLAYLDSLRQLWTATMEIRGLLLRGSLSRR